MERETNGHSRRTPATMLLPAVLLLALALVVALSGTFRDAVETVSLRMTSPEGYRALVLHGNSAALSIVAPSSSEFPSFWRELVIAGAAILLALAALYPSALGRAGELISQALGAAMRPLRTLHSGRIGDYIAWFVFGVAAYGGFLLLRAR